MQLLTWSCPAGQDHDRLLRLACQQKVAECPTESPYQAPQKNSPNLTKPYNKRMARSVTTLHRRGPRRPVASWGLHVGESLRAPKHQGRAGRGPRLLRRTGTNATVSGRVADRLLCKHPEKSTSKILEACRGHFAALVSALEGNLVQLGMLRSLVDLLSNQSHGQTSVEGVAHG